MRDAQTKANVLIWGEYGRAQRASHPAIKGKASRARRRESKADAAPKGTSAEMNAWQKRCMSDWKKMFVKLRGLDYECEHASPFFNFGERGGKVLSLSDFVRRDSLVVMEENFRPRTTTCQWKTVNCMQRLVGWMEVKADKCGPASGGEFYEDNVRKYNIFVRGFKNLYEYGMCIKEGLVDEEQHMRLFDELILPITTSIFSAWPNAVIRLINHNRDIPILHFKFRCDNCPGNSRAVRDSWKRHRDLALDPRLDAVMKAIG
jgi:hypothetical protein